MEDSIAEAMEEVHEVLILKYEDPNERARLIRAVGRDMYDEDQKIYAIVEKMVKDQSCKGVWKALEKRLDLAEKIHREKLAQSGIEVIPGSNLECNVVTTLGGQILELSFVVYEALKEKQFRNVATPPERKSLEKKFKKAMKQVTEALSLLTPKEDDADENIIEKALFKYSRSISESIFISLQEDKKSSMSDGQIGNIMLAAGFALQNPIAILGCLTEAVEEWAKKAPLIAKPNNKGADRLRLIQALTAHFVDQYSTPLHSCVLALTNSFFPEIEGLTESTIQKLTKDLYRVKS